MVTAYAHAGYLQDAEDLFTQMPAKDAVSWTAMMAAYSRNGHPTQALRVFRQMDLEGIHPTGITFITALDACAMIPSLALGRIIAATIDFVEPRLEPAIQSCLLQLYGRCGALGDAKAVFDSMRDRNVVTWSSIIAANAQNGHGHRALELFYSMLLEGVLPVEITLISVLHACCHSGLSGNAPQFFQSISSEFELRPIADHFVCMIDVFGRSGEIENAADLIASMPFEPNAVAWTILLNACRMHKDVERAKRITDRIVRLDGSWQYALLTGIHAENEKVVN
ncbi:pentatricopeptide repeat-containing protein At4g21065-like [Selaginella moellendorffii]|uniref:pentatricopeptide repeat-containing protein At4g21065-like n=1 Tax=Selaginella moellendorffii TaxID=88036 RepID=UPI000D1CDA43|nr:pentatricopeptide repeat-containing protein At4g21065-like [Selaginella moellendorffii]|eukprot:XP_024516154.1 pentatricopeptide repeat-containing protein At4g21065-like [Selaginella moellendorffii]